MKCCIAFLILHSIHTSYSQHELNCYTSTGDPGTCINIKQCHSALEVLKRKIPDEVQSVISSRCGPSVKPPNICCPENANPAIVTRVSANDIQQHPNYPKINPKRCGYVSTDKVTGGNITQIFEFPWMALISYRTGSTLEFKCAGTVITDRYVLTAGHCVSGLNPGTTLAGIRLGEHNISTPQDCLTIPTENGPIRKCAPKVQDVAIEKVIVHPNYTRVDMWSNDIALVKLKRPADFTRPNIARICLPFRGDTGGFATNLATVVGWGTTETGYASDVLLKANLDVLSGRECLRTYGQVTPRHICALGSVGVDSCDGDSGGPLMIVEDIGYVQYGIVSIGTPFCGIIQKPGIYTNVASFMPWILDNIL